MLYWQSWSRDSCGSEEISLPRNTFLSNASRSEPCSMNCIDTTLFYARRPMLKLNEGFSKNEIPVTKYTFWFRLLNDFEFSCTDSHERNDRSTVCTAVHSQIKSKTKITARTEVASSPSRSSTCSSVAGKHYVVRKYKF